jgi:hypothetical protein
MLLVSWLSKTDRCSSVLQGWSVNTANLSGCSQLSKTLWALGHMSPSGQSPVCCASSASNGSKQDSRQLSKHTASPASQHLLQTKTDAKRSTARRLLHLVAMYERDETTASCILQAAADLF